MRTHRFVHALFAAAAAAFIGVTASSGVLAATADEPEDFSLAWLADAISLGDADVQVFATDLSGANIELSDEFRDQLLSFVAGALRSGGANGSVSAAVIVMDDSGNVIYSGGEVPGDLDELIGLLAN